MCILDADWLTTMNQIELSHNASTTWAKGRQIELSQISQAQTSIICMKI